jgi:hypothetical protein
LLSIKSFTLLDGGFDKCMPMGCSISCSTFEKCSTFLHWLTAKESNSENLDHYLDDEHLLSIKSFTLLDGGYDK